MPLPLLIALWAFMRAHPSADFDAFAVAYYRGLTLLAREQAKARERGDG